MMSIDHASEAANRVVLRSNCSYLPAVKVFVNIMCVIPFLVEYVILPRAEILLLRTPHFASKDNYF